MNLLLTFIIANLLNVSLSTAKTLITVKCGKGVSAIVSALYYAFYTYVIVLTMCELSMYEKMAVVGICNIIGVYFVKWLQEKMRKDKIWLVKMTIPNMYAETAKILLGKEDIPFTYYDLNKYFVFDTFCETQAETATVTKICSICCGKAFATENKLNL